MLAFPAIAALLFQTATTPDSAAPVRDPAYSRDGRLAVSVRGDLWVVSKQGAWTRVTSGAAWDREPAWTPDGSAIVFSSDRAGNFDLWRIGVGANGTAAEPERITTSPLADAEPTVAPDGRIYFVRGRLGAAVLWVRAANGTETRVTTGRAVERWPRVSADGARLAYVTIGDGTRKLHVRTVDGGRDTSVLTDARLERPSWSPTGDRIAWTASGARGPVYVTPVDGRYVNLISTRHAEAAWNPDGKSLALAELPASDAIAPVGYNGDPDRTDREANLLAPASGHLWMVDAPMSPDTRLA